MSSEELQKRTPRGKAAPRVLLLVVLILAVLIPASFRYWPRPELLEVPRSELVLKEGRLYRIGENQPFTGHMLERYPNAALKSRSEIRDGRMDGLSEGWGQNGQLEIRERFREGVSHGVRLKWYPSGAKMSEAIIQNGKLNGTFIRWHENGAVAEQIEMRDGEPDGPSIAFYTNGSVKAKATLKMGKVIEQKFWKEGELTASNSTQVPN